MNKFSYISCLALLLGGCAWPTSPTMSSAVTGGVAGTAIGAGTGALIGSAISHGDVAMSALAGAGIGLGAGAAIGAAYTKVTEQVEMGVNNSRIRDNQEHILNTNSEIQSLRQDLDAEHRDIEIEYSAEQPFQGPRLGVPTR